MSKWQPIETAPKDETWVLLWFKDDCSHPEPIVHSGFWSEEGASWFDSEASSNSLVNFYGNPVFWMPYEPPK